MYIRMKVVLISEKGFRMEQKVSSKPHILARTRSVSERNLRQFSTKMHPEPSAKSDA